MDALELIKQQLNQNTISLIFSHYNIKIVNDGANMIRCACPIHKGSNTSAFVFNIEKGMYYCHACGAYGDLVQLIQELNGWTKEEDFVKALDWTLDFLHLSKEGLEIKKKPSKLQKDLIEWKKFITKKISTPILKRYSASYESKRVTGFRKFQKETLEKFDLRYAENIPFITKEGKETIIRKRLTMPILFHEEIVGEAMRRTNEAENPKWLFQPTGLNKRNLIYNLKDKWYEELTICEGIFDVWAFDEIDVEAGCVLGRNITNEQIGLLRKHTLSLNLAFDGDERGRNATCIAIDALKNSFDLRVVDFSPEDDPDSCSRAKLRELHDNKLHYADWINLHKSDWEEHLKTKKR